MLLTVLIVLASATIAALAVQVSVNAAGSQQRRLAMLSARETAAAVEARTRQLIETDPLRVYVEVLPEELPRRCDADPVTYPDPFEPGDPWPATCGQVWSYEGSAARTSGVRVRPPSPTSPVYSLDVLARVGPVRTGYTVELTAGTAQRPFLYSAAGLDLTALAAGAGTFDATGSFYALGEIETGTIELTDRTLLASETGLVAEPGGDPIVAVPEDVVVDLPVGQEPVDIRAIHAAPFTTGTLERSLRELTALACLDETPSVVGGLATSFCLVPGRDIVEQDGDLLEVPAAAAFLLLPNGDGTLTLYSRARIPASWPGPLASWGTPLGVFPLPAAAVIHSSLPVVVGLCAESDGVCAAQGGTLPGLTMQDHLTVLAGTALAPADVVLGSPVHSGTGTLGVFASGSVILPAGAVPDATSLSVRVDVASLAATPLLSSGASGARPGLSVHGAIIAEGLTLDTAAFTDRSLLPARATSAWSPAPGLVLRTAHVKAFEAATAELLLPVS